MRCIHLRIMCGFETVGCREFRLEYVLLSLECCVMLLQCWVFKWRWVRGQVGSLFLNLRRIGLEKNLKRRRGSSFPPNLINLLVVCLRLVVWFGGGNWAS